MEADSKKQDESVLEEAQRLVTGPRQQDYDHPLDNFNRIASMWTALTKDVYRFTPEQVALFMVAVKLCRQAHRPQRDNIVDICGYAATHEMVEQEKKNRILNQPISSPPKGH